MAQQECKELKEDDWSWSCWVEFWACCCCMNTDDNPELLEYYVGKQKHYDCKASKNKSVDSGAPKFTNLRY